jgi:outer membrane protein OmpA-like peptidoglycan-associated protein
MAPRKILLAATALAAPLALTLAVAHLAAAQPVSGFYAAIAGGYSIEEGQKIKNIIINNVAQPYEARIGLHNGYAGNFSVGYGFGNGWRIEIEGDYDANRYDEIKAKGGDTPLHGAEQKYGTFINGLYDFDVGLPYFYPYVGGGVGWQIGAYNNVSGGGLFIAKTKGTFAYQGIAGFAIPISYVPGLSFTADYRFLGSIGSRKLGPGRFTPADEFSAGHEFNNISEGGLRYEFGATPPMAPSPSPVPVSAPAPAVAKTYLIFFDWDKYSLSPRATAIIAQAASDSKTQNTTTINVSGYTDTSGTPDYNQGLSERRAKAVAAQLVTDGISESEIEIHAYGETHLLVPTGPGVREPQNRRVEIVLE